MDQLARLTTALADRYTIEYELGAGGMATVYLAEDLKHHRKVAVKVLRPELAAVLGAARFVQEITTTANLQHPHILPLFDSGEADSFLFYVMPFIDGETLRDKLDRETQLGIDEAVKIATEVADALDYAHRHNVIHRDVKPENILLHDGRPLVADFGIALAVSAAAGGRMTETGLSLGTPHYMSPEQATAEKDLTHRSDIYSVGSMLYEMLTGQPPHVGASAQQIIMKIVTEEAAPVTEVRKSVPPNVAGAVAKALEKLPADRFDTGKAFAEALLDPAYRPGLVAGSELATDPVTDWRARMTVPLAIVAVLLLIVAVWGWLRPIPESTLFGRFEIPLQGSPSGGLAVSPDSRTIVYQGEDGQLMLRERGNLESRLVAGGLEGWSPFFSPDGASIGYLTGFPGSLVIVGIGGGTPRVIVADSATAYGGAWGTDGAIYYTSASGSLLRIPADGGTAQVLASPDTAAGHQWLAAPDLLPGEDAAIVTILGHDAPQIGVTDFATGSTTILSPGSFARFASPDYVLIGRGTGEVAALPFDPDRLAATGPEVLLGDRIHTTSAGYTMAFALAPNEELFYVGTGGSARPGTLVRVDLGGRSQPVDPGWSELFSGIAISPDGTQLAMGKFVEGRDEIWLKTLDQGPLSRLSAGGPLSYRPSWSPDGRSIIFSSDRGASNLVQVYRVSAMGGGDAELLYRTTASIDEAELSSDGQWLLYRTGAGGGRDIYAFQWETNDAPVAVAVTEFEEYSPTFSPNGRFVAYVSNESGRAEVYVRPFPDASAAKWPVSSRGGTEPRWSNGGRELFYRNGAGALVAVRLASGPAFAIAAEDVLFSTLEFMKVANHSGYEVLPDDDGFLFVHTGGERNGSIVMVQNWRSALGRPRGR